NTSQARVYRAFGADRIILANQLVEPASVRWLASELKRDPAFDLYCLVDSPAQVSKLEMALDGTGLRRPLQVLLELGVSGGRTGCRTREETIAVAKAVAGSKHLGLAGIEAFEGVIHREDQPATLRAVDSFLADMRTRTAELAAAGLFSEA